MTGLPNGGFVVATQRTLSSYSYDLHYYNAAGVPTATVALATVADGDLPDIAVLPSGELLVTYRAYTQGGAQWDIYGQLFGVDGTRIGSAFVINAGADGFQTQPNVSVLTSGEVVVTSTDVHAPGDSSGTGITGQILKLDNSISSLALSNTLVAENLPENLTVGVLGVSAALNASVTYQIVDDPRGAFAISGNRLIVRDNAGLDYEAGATASVTVRATNDAGNSTEQTFNIQIANMAEDQLFTGSAAGKLGGNTIGGMEAIGSDRVLVILDSGLGLAGQITDSAGNLIGSQFTISNPNAPNDLYSSFDLLPNGNFVLTWFDGGLRGRVFDASGTPVGAQFLANTTGSVGLSDSVVTTGNGGFAIIYDTVSGSAREVAGQLFDATGQKVGGEFLVNTSTSFDQGSSQAIGLGNGSFVVVWNDQSNKDTQSRLTDVRAQVFGSDGQKIGGEILVNTATMADQLFDTVTKTGNGFVVTWLDRSTAPANAKAQFFDSTGAKIGGEVSVAAIPSNTVPQATIELPNGHVVLSWTVDSQRFGQEYTADGVVVGSVIPLPEGEIVRLANGSFIGINSLASGVSTVEILDHGLNRDTLPFSVSDAIGQLGTTLPDILAVGNGFVVRYADNGGSGATNGLRYFTPAGAALTGSGGDDVLIGGDGPDQVVGRAGNDRLDGRGGADQTDGGTGDDMHYVDNAGDVVIERVGGGNDRVLTSVSYALAAAAEVEMLTTTDNFGTAAINLTGNAFSQAIFGNAGANIIDGGGGEDSLVGLGSNDWYFVDSAGDLVYEAAGGGYDRVFARASYHLNASAQVEVLATYDESKSDAIDLTGNELDNVVVGNAGSNRLEGGGGSDDLIGLGGDDRYYVDSNDHVYESAGGGNDRVFASTSYTLRAGSEVETLSTTDNAGHTALDLTGNELSQAIYGNDAPNVLDGKGGADDLIGFGGNDIFAFTSAIGPGTGNVDQIYGFVSGVDRVALDDAVFTGLATGTLAASAFVTGTAAQDADDRIVFNAATGQLFFDADGSGAGAAIHFATLTGGVTITAADFVVV